MKTSDYRLNQLDKLDVGHPGLLDAVRNWLDRGVAAARIPRLLKDQYQVEVGRGVLEAFRARHWARERERINERKMEMLAQIEADRTLDLRRGHSIVAWGDMQ